MEILIHHNFIELKKCNSKDIPMPLISSLTEYDTFTKWPKIKFQAIVTEIMPDKTISTLIPRYVPKKLIQESFPNVTPTYSNEYSKLPVFIDDRLSFNHEFPFRDELQKTCSDYLNDDSQPNKVITMNMGTGKTYSTIRYFSERQFSTMIFVHSTNLIESPWIKDILKFSNITSDDICLLQGVDTIKRELKRITTKNQNPKPVYIMMLSTANALLRKEPAKKILLQSLFSAAKITLKVFDEAHLGYKAIFFSSMFLPSAYTLFLSATMSRTNPSSRKVFEKIIPYNSLWFDMSDFEEDFEPFWNVMQLPFNSNPSEMDKANIMIVKNSTDNKFSIPNYHSYYINNDLAFFHAYRRIAKVVKYCSTNNFRLMMFFGTLEMIAKVREQLKLDFPNKKLGELTSNVESEEKANTLTSDIILTTVMSVQAGLDLPLDAILLFTPMTSKITLKQIIGRIRFKGTEHPHPVFDIYDEGFEPINESAKTRTTNLKTIVNTITRTDTTSKDKKLLFQFSKK